MGYLSFEEMCELKAGDELFENGYGQSIPIKLTTDAQSDEKKVWFKAIFQGEETDYGSTKGLTHYGPKLSWQKEYYSYDEIQEFLKQNAESRFSIWASSVEYHDVDFNIKKDDDRLYLQLQWEDVCSVTEETCFQKSRKWFLSEHMTKSEFVQTCLKAVLTMEEHEIREKFKYKDQPIFRPHYDVDVLHELCENGTVDQILDLRK
jgi:hypothetical protein